MRTFSRTNQFKKDVKRALSRRRDIAKLKRVMDLLIDGNLPPSAYKNHPLHGEWKGSHDCHIEPDWILIYTVENNHVRFERTGAHHDLFR